MSCPSSRLVGARPIGATRREGNDQHDRSEQRSHGWCRYPCSEPCGAGHRRGRPGVGHRVLPRDHGRLQGAAGVVGQPRPSGPCRGRGHRLIWCRADPLPGRARRGGGRGQPAEPSATPPARQVRPERRRGRRPGRPQRRSVRCLEGRRRARRGDQSVGIDQAKRHQGPHPGGQPGPGPDRHRPSPAPIQPPRPRHRRPCRHLRSVPSRRDQRPSRGDQDRAAEPVSASSSAQR